ncbi:Lrp/AsnC family transcriptional regulator [Streptomyces chartreusis]|uniref:Lrp/AsnC family transcriptional regulator n=1 Tax=Streptomyces chartreusis TaxID=1969 RepID=UPI0035DB7369
MVAGVGVLGGPGFQTAVEAELHVLRLATELDLALLGAHTEALLWITVRPGALQKTAQTLGAHPHVRFCAATTGPANLLVALAATNLDALYTFLTDTVGSLDGVTSIDTAPCWQPPNARA